MATTLETFLGAYASQGGDIRHAVAGTIEQLAATAIKVRDLISEGPLPEDLGARRGSNGEGDDQKGLDVLADEMFLEACRAAGAAVYASEERPEPVMLREDGLLAVAIDPVDGSSNIESNISIGTIFSFLPTAGLQGAEPAAYFLQPGHRQVASGFFIYGPQLALVVTMGSGAHLFVYSPAQRAFIQSPRAPRVPERTQEFAINMSNERHWDEGIRVYIEDCLRGAEGPREKDFNMRWVASMVAECYRILNRGGVYLYPGDARKGYRNGRLRLVYEANPISFLIEQAGGAATDTLHRILDIQPESLHQRVPFVFGSAHEVERVGRYVSQPAWIAERSPLFGRRGLLRA